MFYVYLFVYSLILDGIVHYVYTVAKYTSAIFMLDIGKGLGTPYRSLQYKINVIDSSIAIVCIKNLYKMSEIL